jgi:HEAT repeat protein
MAGIVDNLTAVTRAWWHYLRLDQTNIELCHSSMQALRNLGDASLPVLRRGIRQHEQPRVQLRCAVILHWLGQREGLPVLVDALRYNSRSPSGVRENDIASCFMLIGSPDATRALIDVWQQLPGLNDNDPTAMLICSIWRLLRDSSMLSILCYSSAQTPGLFVDTIAVFGAEALSDLKVLARDENPDRRTMALRGLEQIPGFVSAQIVISMLQDGNSEVRAIAAAALETISGPVTTLNALVEAHRAGFSTAVSVQMLVLYNPPELFVILATLLTRYDPFALLVRDIAQGASEYGDTVGAAREAALAFARCPWPHAQVTQILCGLVDRRIDPWIKAAAAQTIADRGRAGDDSDIQAYKAMWRMLTIVDRDARAAAVAALARLGEPLGKSFEALLDSGRPQTNLLHNLHSALLNSQDVGQAMSEAVQHVATWFSRVSKVTAKRFSSDSAQGSPSEAALKDRRVPDLLRQMLANVLEGLESAESAETTVEALSIGVGTLRAIARLDSASVQFAAAELGHAYTVVKRVGADTSPSKNSGPGVEDDAAGVLREAAGQALIDIYGNACFDILCGGLDHQEDNVKATSAIALGRLGDRRAVPMLQPIADKGSAVAVRAAQEALAAIKRGNPEMMTLLRGSSSAEARTDTLLRPITGINDALSPELLLRPANSGPAEQ